MKTKKYIIPLMLCLLIIGVVIFLMALPNKPSGTVDTIELDEVVRFTEDELENRLIGELRENIIHSWGNPHSILNGQDTVAFEFPDGDKYKSITLFYEDNIIVNIVLE